jgi:hypothetical protein
MTHDELLGRIDYWFDTDNFHLHKNALRAVVEFHKPRVHIADCCKDTVNPMDCSESYIACEGCNIYPCATIRAIEKELT